MKVCGSVDAKFETYIYFCDLYKNDTFVFCVVKFEFCKLTQKWLLLGALSSTQAGTLCGGAMAPPSALFGAQRSRKFNNNNTKSSYMI
jgi:hypothetical protein